MLKNKLSEHDEQVLDICRRKMRGEDILPVEQELIDEEFERIMNNPSTMRKINALLGS